MGKPIAPLTADSVPVNNVVFGPDGVLLASTAADQLRLWSGATGRQLWSVRADQHGVAGLAIARDVIATGGHDATVKLWSAATGTPVRQAIQAHTATVWALAFSPDARRVVSASEDRTLKIWDVATGTLLIGPIVGHDAGVRSVAFSPDGSRIVSGGGIPYEAPNQQKRLDYSLRLWDAASGLPIGRPLTGHSSDVESVAFSRDGMRVVSASADHTLRTWDVLGAWADALCGKLSRNPTASEWREWVSPAIGYVCPCPGLGTEPACQANTKRADQTRKR
jgi:WD40 repeat protein